MLKVLVSCTRTVNKNSVNPCKSQLDEIDRDISQSGRGRRSVPPVDFGGDLSTATAQGTMKLSLACLRAEKARCIGLLGFQVDLGVRTDSCRALTGVTDCPTDPRSAEVVLLVCSLN